MARTLITHTNVSSGDVAPVDSSTWVHALGIEKTLYQAIVDGDIGGSHFGYTNAEATPTTVGGIEAGSTFANVPMDQMWTSLLYAYQYPTFSSLAISGQSATIEVGASIASNRTFTWSTTNPTNIAPNSITIRDVTGATNIVTSLANTGSYASTYPAITNVAAASNVFSITGTNTKPTTFTRTYTVSWKFYLFYGESVTTPLTAGDIAWLRASSLASGFAGTYVFLAGGYKYICYPTSFGTATTFKDASNNLPVAMQAPYVVSVTNGFGVTANYNVHRTFNVLGGAITIIVS